MAPHYQNKILSDFFNITSRGLGGAIGAIFRYLIWINVENNYSNNTYWASIIVNLIGAFLAGLSFKIIYPTKVKFINEMRSFRYGFISGFTVFNWFIFDLYSLFISGRILTACIIIVFCLIIGRTLYDFGSWIGKKITRKTPEHVKSADLREIPWEGKQ